MPVFEGHAAVLDPHHRTDEAGLRVLDDHPDLERLLGRAGLAVRVLRQDVGAVSIGHPVIVGTDRVTTVEPRGACWPQSGSRRVRSQSCE
ncbi:hypothetical protein [Mycobacterium kyogaense]|uniref:hypothetical protein n=1 Tax=Mycobacterium kyogaense TaxID=2212479 RepID=UPI003FA57A96